MIKSYTYRKNHIKRSILQHFLVQFSIVFLTSIFYRLKVEQLSQFTDTKELAHKIILDSSGSIPPRFEPDVEKNLKELQQKRSELVPQPDSRLFNFAYYGYLLFRT